MAKYKIASINVIMDVCYEPLKTQAEPYLYDSDEYYIDLRELYNERIKHSKILNHLSTGEIEYMLYGSLFYEELVKHHGFLLHSSCVVRDGLAYLFSAPSGTGKSTHTNLWVKNFPDAFILNDDKPAILINHHSVIASGTPFSGKTSLNHNSTFPIKGICFLKRAKDNKIKKITKKEALYLILNSTIRPNDASNMDLLFSSVDEVLNKVDCYELECNMNDDACIVSYEGMKNGNC